MQLEYSYYSALPARLPPTALSPRRENVIAHFSAFELNHRSLQRPLFVHAAWIDAQSSPHLACAFALVDVTEQTEQRLVFLDNRQHGLAAHRYQ